MDSDAGGYVYPPEGGGHHAGLIIIVLIVLTLALGAGAMLGAYMARQQAASRRALSRKVIFDDVNKALKKALEKREDELLGAAKDLIKVIMDRLGPFVLLGGPIFADIAALNKALSGKTAEPAGHGHGDHGAHGDHGHDKAESSTSAAKVGSTLVLTPNVTTHIHVGGEADKKKDGHAPPEKPKDRDMTMPEVYEAVGKAVEKFKNDWQREKVETFLTAAQKALLEAKPRDPGPERH